MSPSLGDIGVFFAPLILVLLVPTYYVYIDSGKLENKVIELRKDKMKLIDKSIIDIIYDIAASKVLDTNQELFIEEEEKDQLFNICYVADDIEKFKDTSSDIRDGVAKSMIFGVICATLMAIISFIYSSATQNSVLDSTIVLIAQFLFVGVIGCGYLYIKMGIYQVLNMRTIERATEQIHDVTDINKLGDLIRNTLEKMK